MAYLSGWMAFDASEHRTAQRYLTLAARIAAEAGDGPLGGHILRALAHQAVDPGHPRRALVLTDASMNRDRYGQASCTSTSLSRPRTSALNSGVASAASVACTSSTTCQARGSQDIDTSKRLNCRRVSRLLTRVGRLRRAEWLSCGSWSLKW